MISEQSIKNDYEQENKDEEVDNMKLGDLFASQKHSSQDKLNQFENIEQAIEDNGAAQKPMISVTGESQKKSEEINKSKSSSFRKQNSLGRN